MVFAAIVPPAIDRGHFGLDLALLAIVSVVVLQMVPLPRGVVGALSPSALTVRDAVILQEARAHVPLSVVPADTFEALVRLLGAVIVYLSARHLFESRGVRLMCRAVGWLGLLLACVSIAQWAVSPHIIYGLLVPEQPGAGTSNP